MTRLVMSEVSVNGCLLCWLTPISRVLAFYIDICMRAERTQPLLNPLRRVEQNAERSRYKTSFKNEVSVCVSTCV